MPTYHFVCDACGKAFEQHLPMGSAVPPCAECKSTNVRKIIKAPMVHFKGSGFYKTDSAKGTSVKKEAKTTNDTKEPMESKPVEAKPDTPKPETPKKSDSPATPA